MPPYRTQENFEVPNFELDTFVDVNDEKGASEWVTAFRSYSKTTMPETRGYVIKGNRVLLRKKRHCIHSHEVRKNKAKRSK